MKQEFEVTIHHLSGIAETKKAAFIIRLDNIFLALPKVTDFSCFLSPGPQQSMFFHQGTSTITIFKVDAQRWKIFRPDGSTQDIEDEAGFPCHILVKI